MKILLITPPNEDEVLDYTTPSLYLKSKNPIVRYMPLGILSVAAGISSHHEVEILDAASLDLSINETIKKINIINPDVLGISAVTRKAYSMAEILQRIDGPVKVVGGPHVTHYSKETVALGADAIFKHDGDRNFNIWLDNGCKSGIFEDYIESIDSLPFPKRELLNLDDYRIKEEQAGQTLLKTSGLRPPMFSSKGCPFRCVFCDVQEKKFRWFSPSRVVDEMEHLISVGCSSIHILDDNFNVKRDRVLEICEEMQNRGLKINWSARGRASIDDEIAQALVDAGCKKLHVGVESLDQDVLNWMNKLIDVDTINNFFETCSYYGIETLGYFILGSPVETRQYREKLPDMVKKLGVTYPYFNILYPASHTKYYQTLLEGGTFERDYWQEFAENPTPNFEIPLPRTSELQEELLGFVDNYNKIFYGTS